jgi:hypothetical protein
MEKTPRTDVDSLLKCVRETNLSEFNQRQLDALIELMTSEVKSTYKSQTVKLKYKSPLNIQMYCLGREAQISIHPTELDQMTRFETFAAVKRTVDQMLDLVYTRTFNTVLVGPSLSMEITFGDDGFKHIISGSVLSRSSRPEIIRSLCETVGQKLDNLLYADVLKEIS